MLMLMKKFHGLIHNHTWRTAAFAAAFIVIMLAAWLGWQRAHYVQFADGLIMPNQKDTYADLINHTPTLIVNYRPGEAPNKKIIMSTIRRYDNFSTFVYMLAQHSSQLINKEETTGSIWAVDNFGVMDANPMLNILKCGSSKYYYVSFQGGNNKKINEYDILLDRNVIQKNHSGRLLYDRDVSNDKPGYILKYKKYNITYQLLSYSKLYQSDLCAEMSAIHSHNPVANLLYSSALIDDFSITIDMLLMQMSAPYHLSPCAGLNGVSCGGYHGGCLFKPYCQLRKIVLSDICDASDYDVFITLHSYALWQTNKLDSKKLTERLFILNNYLRTLCPANHGVNQQAIKLKYAVSNSKSENLNSFLQNVPYTQPKLLHPGAFHRFAPITPIDYLAQLVDKQKHAKSDPYVPAIKRGIHMDDFAFFATDAVYSYCEIYKSIEKSQRNYYKILRYSAVPDNNLSEWYVRNDTDLFEIFC